MKKITTTALILTVILCLLCACNSTPTTSSDTNTTASSSNTEEEIDISIFPEVETSSESSIDIYRAEVLKRLKALEEDEDALFISDEEWDIISNYGDLSDDIYRHNASITEFSIFEEKSEYFYPVLFREDDALVMWYTSKYGSVLLERVYGYWNSSNYVGKLHSDSEEEEWIKCTEEYTLTYSSDTGIVSAWQFGEKATTYSGIPQGSIYCGYSALEGYIFRNGTDVHSLKAIQYYSEETESLQEEVITNCIAHNVQYVIDADYSLGSDPWCQPLFQMTDGSIKCYISWEGDQDTPDSPSHLVDLKYEGGYDK